MACGSSAGVVGATALGVLAELLVATDELAAGSFSSPSTALLIAPRTSSPATTSTHGRLWNGFFAGGPACGTESRLRTDPGVTRGWAVLPRGAAHAAFLPSFHVAQACAHAPAEEFRPQREDRRAVRQVENLRRRRGARGTRGSTPRPVPASSRRGE